MSRGLWILLVVLTLAQASCVPVPIPAQSTDPLRPLEFCVVTGFPVNYGISQIDSTNDSFLKIFSGKLADQTVIRKASVDDTQYCDVMVLMPQLMDKPLKVDVLSAYSKAFLMNADSIEPLLPDRWATAINDIYAAFRPGTALNQKVMAERLQNSSPQK